MLSDRVKSHNKNKDFFDSNTKRFHRKQKFLFCGRSPRKCYKPYPEYKINTKSIQKI